MVKTIIGTKAEMTSKFNELGKLIPVTKVVAEPNVIIKTGDKIQIASGRAKKVKKPQNHLMTAVGFAPKIVREIEQTSQEGEGEIKMGDQIKVSVFEVGDIVKITGTTKGHGFAGGMKRHGFHGGPKTHGQSDRHRAPGSIGKGTTPGRVFKGKKMAGHYGNVRFTVTGLEVVGVDENENILLVKGAVPGWQNGTVIVEKTGKVKKHIPLYDETKPQTEEKPKDDAQEQIAETLSDHKNPEEQKVETSNPPAENQTEEKTESSGQPSAIKEDETTGVKEETSDESNPQAETTEKTGEVKDAGK